MIIGRISNRTLFLVIFLLAAKSLAGQHPVDEKPGYLGESNTYVFYSHYWLNLHHFLQQEALINEVSKKSTVSEVVWKKMPRSDQEKLNSVIAYYRENLIGKDLRMSDYMLELKEWLIEQPENDLSPHPDKFKKHLSRLVTVDKLYRNIFWQEHHAANQQVLGDNLQLISNTEEFVVDKLSELTREKWQADKIRVDITFFAKSTPRNMKNRPYTSLGPTHVVMNSARSANKPAGDWLELLYHESSHALIGSRSGFVGGTITDVCKVLNEQSPRSLWHAYLFYFSGKISQEAFTKQGLEEYEIYMIRNKVFSWYLPHLQKYLPGYMKHDLTLKDATEQIIKEINKTN